MSYFGNRYRFKPVDPIDPWSRTNSINQQPYGIWSQMPFQNVGQETALKTGVEDTTGRKQVTSEQAVDVLPEDKYAIIKERLAKDPEYQRAVLAVEAMDKINQAKLMAPAQLDISPLGNAAAVILNDPRLAQVAQRRPSSVEELSDIQKGAAGSVEGYQRLASIADAFLGRQLSTKVKNELIEQEGTKNYTQQTEAAKAAGTNVPPRAAAKGGARKITVNDAKQQEKIGLLNSNIEEMTEKLKNLTDISVKYKGKVPGIGPKGWLVSTRGKVKDLLGAQQTETEKDATYVRNSIDWISALQVYDRSGKAVTSAEFERAKKYVTAGNFATFKEFEKAFNDFIKVYKTKQTALYQGFQPENVEAVKNRRNVPPEMLEGFGTGSTANPKADKYKQKQKTERMKP